MARIKWKRAIRIVVTVGILGALFAGAGMLVQSKQASLAAAPRYGVGALPVRVPPAPAPRPWSAQPQAVLLRK